MKQWAFTLPLILCIAGTTACSSTSTGATGAAGHAGASGSGAAGAGGGTSGTGGTAGTGGGGAVLLPIDMTGYMKYVPLNIQGAWYAYGDAIGSTGAPPGDCNDPAKGNHMAAECSNITTPTAGTFTNMGGAMHTAGTVEQVISLVGMTGCEATAMTKTNCDYNNMWGAGIGVDLNNAGNADGGTAMKMPYDATTNHVVGISFDLDAVPVTGLRIEFPMPTTSTSAHVYQPDPSTFNSPVVAGPNVIMWTDLAQPSYVTMTTPFDPSQLLSVQFHIPTTTSSSGSYDFTVSNFSAITQ